MNLPTFTVLIVEDLPENRAVYRESLLSDSSCAYDLIEAGSVAEGLELYSTNTIDAILLDYLLPDGDGLKFLEIISQRSPGRSLPVVMMTGHGSESVAVRAMKLGAQDYLVKGSFTPQLLISAMQSAIENARLRRQLQQSHDLLRVSIDTMLDCFGIYAAIRDETGQIIDFRFEYLNAAAMESNRMTAADIGRGMCEVFPAVCETELFERYCQTIATGVPLVQDDLIYTDVFGTQQLTKVYDTRVSRLNDGFVATWRDVTVERQAEQERDRFFNLSLDLLAIGNFDGYFIRLNPAFEQMLGYTIAELMARPFLDFVHPDDREQTIASATRLSEGQMEIDFENRYRCKDGSYRWLSWSAIPHTERNLCYAVGRDITERKQTDRYLQESQAQLKTGIEVAGIGLAKFDYVSNLVELSPEAAALYGLPTEESVISRDRIHATFHPDDRAQLEQQIAQVLDPQGQGWFAQEHRVVWSNGEVRCLSVRKQVFFDRSGAVARPSYAILAAIDITERNRTQTALEHRNQELDSFVYIVSHDLKAPLRAITNLSRWIEEDLESSLTVANQAQMTLLRSRVERMSATIDGLLDYARTGQTTDISSESVVVAQLLAEVIDSLSPPPTFCLDIAPMPTISTNRLLLFQVFVNLIGNAIKHHDRSDGSIHISAQERGDCYEFAVSDDGAGIAPEQHERVFRIFQAVNPQNRADSKGIGLAIVKKIVQAQGGTIWLESQLGKGTTFYFTWLK
ncbi:PAS domain-containing protein [Chamaesiphon sp.]|uniref:PAS domain-containing protein n=1 Tax=Chamaesiphon sp. TaxID=2814140 RepID=UPI0035946EB2